MSNSPPRPTSSRCIPTGRAGARSSSARGASRTTISISAHRPCRRSNADTPRIGWTSRPSSIGAWSAGLTSPRISRRSRRIYTATQPSIPRRSRRRSPRSSAAGDVRSVARAPAREPRVDALNQAAFSLWDASITWAELLGDLTGALCVWLVARQHIANWPIGLANNIFWCLLFWRAKLYADSVLQIVFFALGVYGWWNWVFGGAAGRNSLPVRRTTDREWMWLTAATVAS